MARALHCSAAASLPVVAVEGGTRATNRAWHASAFGSCATALPCACARSVTIVSIASSKEVDSRGRMSARAAHECSM